MLCDGVDVWRAVGILDLVLGGGIGSGFDSGAEKLSNRIREVSSSSEAR